MGISKRTTWAIIYPYRWLIVLVSVSWSVQFLCLWEMPSWGLTRQANEEITLGRQATARLFREAAVQFQQDRYTPVEPAGRAEKPTKLASGVYRD